MAVHRVHGPARARVRARALHRGFAHRERGRRPILRLAAASTWAQRASSVRRASLLPQRPSPSPPPPPTAAAAAAQSLATRSWLAAPSPPWRPLRRCSRRRRAHRPALTWRGGGETLSRPHQRAEINERGTGDRRQHDRHESARQTRAGGQRQPASSTTSDCCTFARAALPAQPSPAHTPRVPCAPRTHAREEAGSFAHAAIWTDGRVWGLRSTFPWPFRRSRRSHRQSLGAITTSTTSAASQSQPTMDCA